LLEKYLTQAKRGGLFRHRAINEMLVKGFIGKLSQINLQ
jgi:hypothetical protein